jgi:hypothetical protein
MGRHAFGSAPVLARPPAGERGQVDAGGPSLGLLRQGPDLAGVQGLAGGGGERLRLDEVEGELGPPDLAQVPLCPEPPEGQIRHASRRDRHLEPGREMVEECRKRVETGGVHQAVNVVEHKQGRAPDPVQLERETRR